MENTDADQKPTPERAEIIERLRLMQAEVDAVKTDLERRVLSRWYEDAKAERDKLHSQLVEVRSALADVSAERDSLRTTLAAWEAADTAPFLKVPDVADHVVPPVLPICTTCHGCGSVLYPSPAGDYFGCGDVRCTRSNTKHWHPGCAIGPYAGPCKSATPVRHE